MMKATLPATEITLLPTDRLKPNPWNRTQFDEKALEELAASIKAEGIREPLLVRATPSSSPSAAPSPQGEGNYYQIASGNRRWLAAQKAGLKEVPCLIAALSDEQVAEDNVTMNIQREDIPPLDLARMLQEYMVKFGKKQKEVARTFGKTQPWVSEIVGFLQVDPKIKNIGAPIFSWDQLRILRKLDPALQRQIADELANGDLKPTQIAKRCNQLRFAARGVQSRFQKKQLAMPDPLAKEWEPIQQKLLATSAAYWETHYGEHRMDSGQKIRGWFFFAAPTSDDSKEALSRWFKQMGAALEGKKVSPPPAKAQQEIFEISEELNQELKASISNLPKPRLPANAAEEKELLTIAQKGTPRTVYAWIYGPSTPFIQSAPATWEAMGVSPKEGLAAILEGIREFSR